nr:MAG TPA: hypothetical protein [Caudoviricetes sp.]
MNICHLVLISRSIFLTCLFPTNPQFAGSFLNVRISDFVEPIPKFRIA